MKNRQSIRLPSYDYSQNGAYFVTICTNNREHLFGNLAQGGKYSTPTWEPTDFGKIAEQCWREIPDHYQNIELDAFVVMPNHIHGIILIESVGVQYLEPRAQNIVPLREHGFQNTLSGSVSSIIRGYKIGVTKGCREISPGIEIWQRNFYEHVIRDENELDRIREYIVNNPMNWAEDDMNSGP